MKKNFFYLLTVLLISCASRNGGNGISTVSAACVDSKFLERIEKLPIAAISVSEARSTANHYCYCHSNLNNFVRWSRVASDLGSKNSTINLASMFARGDFGYKVTRESCSWAAPLYKKLVNDFEDASFSDDLLYAENGCTN